MIVDIHTHVFDPALHFSAGLSADMARCGIDSEKWGDVCAEHPLDDSRPVHFDAVAVDFPELRMVLAHPGHPWEGECIAVIRRHPHVYADLSALYL